MGRCIWALDALTLELVHGITLLTLVVASWYDVRTLSVPFGLAVLLLGCLAVQVGMRFEALDPVLCMLLLTACGCALWRGRRFLAPFDILVLTLSTAWMPPAQWPLFLGVVGGSALVIGLFYNGYQRRYDGGATVPFLPAVLVGYVVAG